MTDQRHIARTILGLTLALLFAGCFDLDSSMFNNDTLTAYHLPTAVIPDSMRTEVMLEVQGKKVYGYFVQAPVQSEKRIVLYNHGNRDHLQFYWDRVELFYQAGFNVFIYDYEGYGKSEGEPTEAALYADATAAYHYVRSRGFGDGQIIVYGFSLGGAPATYLAANVFTPRLLMLEAAFASGSALAQSGMLLDLPGTFVMKGTFDNAGRIGNVASPVVLFHGTNDTFIDLEKNGRVLYNRANDPKTFLPVTGAGHSNVPWTMGAAAYRDTLRHFFQ